MSTKVDEALEVFWQQGVFDYFSGFNNLNIHYAKFKNTEKSPVIVISPGRCESYLKYQETIYELFQLGYSIFILDHRGQGFSDRMLTNHHKGYVEHFDDYPKDLHQFITTIVNPESANTAPFLLAHSMGCAITLRMLQLYPNPNIIQCAALLSPMIAINTGGLTHRFSTLIINVLLKINRICSAQPWYFIGQSNYKAKPYSQNKLTHCKSRYYNFINLYKKNKQIQLGGVTIHWLDQAFKTESQIFTQLNKIQTPLIVIQAGDDCIVDNLKQNIFCEQLNQISSRIISKAPVTIKGAYHELLFETDSVRTETLARVLQFFDDAKSG